jgi:hypothetical protein
MKSGFLLNLIATFTETPVTFIGVICLVLCCSPLDQLLFQLGSSSASSLVTQPSVYRVDLFYNSWDTPSLLERLKVAPYSPSKSIQLHS